MGWRNTTLTIANGATESEELNLIDGARRKKDITFIMPSTLPESVTVHIANQVGGTYRPIDDGYGNPILLGASKAQTAYGIIAGALKLVAGSATGGARVFTVQGVAVK